MNNTNTATVTEMYKSIISQLRGKLAVDAAQFGADAASDTAHRFIAELVTAGVPDNVARLIVVDAIK